MTAEEFRELLNKHDWAYMYSDDPNVHSKGQKEWETIASAMRGNPELGRIYEEFKGKR